MIYINSYGWRWGNTCFQLACAAALAKRNGDNFVVPNLITGWENVLNYKFNVQKPPYPLKSEWKEGDHFHYREIPYSKDMAINGYFQSEKYFADCKDYISELLEPKPEIVQYLKDNFPHVIDLENSCSIHVRRGDYLKYPDNHPVVNMNYILKAMRQYPRDTKFVVFSDDLEWCRENMRDERFVYPNKSNEMNPDYLDFYLMSMCKHNIICNSSFSWWAAWLNKNPDKKIVAPAKWFGPAYAHFNTDDLYCEGWVKI